MKAKINEILTVESVKQRLKDVVSPNYQWPDEVGEGYALEFIWHHQGFLILDFLNKEKAMFWSEAANVVMQTPFSHDGKPITYQHLEESGIPFMS
ncbi:hypothetical protein ABMY12_20855 [Vibrio vulnificus]|uniref:hypothetical protein n=1 Tax=Vibrio vulnificus TaxID=672 RepID=UPI00405A30D6